MTGTITRALLLRGFAFIRGDDGFDYFLHADEWRGSWDGKNVYTSVRVEFTPSNGGEKGNKLRAMEAKPNV